jgi:maltooligosyltrehalose synthase
MATTQSGTSGSSTTRGSGSGTQAGMGRGGRRGTPDDATYDLISVMYHTLQGCETYEQYAQDAEQAGQQEIAQFFREVQQQNERLAQRGQQLLAQCLQQQGQGGRSGQMHSQQNFVSSGQQVSSGMSGSGSGSTGGSSAGTRSGGSRGGSGSV